ncbi:CMGC/SRPK protein kinase [Helicocarpus griseus UAMH5409]|uniref:non-specific serine/threonine protein kinase n=1 Tax=Helicocarpus griseus UAMH5409 TaxID=1447875 RepID=A0A2B7WWE4_9EURO|nr:CMGC/SRPK protein kinase [Helicocarpus griseus UAMH5409]
MLSSEKGLNICYEYDWISGTESLAKYKPGGYHPIMIGDILHNRYHIVDKLGIGGYSTIWLARDTQSQHYVAVKVGIADSLLNETTIHRALSSPSPMSSTSLKSADLLKGRDSIPIPLDEFKLRGPNGIHPCYTMDPGQCNLKESSYSRLFPLDVARALTAGLTLAVAYVHSQGYVHGDIHLRNVVAKLPSSFNELSIEQLYQKYEEPETVRVTERHGKPLPPNVPNLAVLPLHLGKYAEQFSLSDTHVLLSDFGEAFSAASGSCCGKDCHTPLAARPPETRFEPQKPLSYASDVWSLAITIWEIIGMKTIFSSEFTTDDEVTSQQVDVLGPMPQAWWARWDRTD